MAILVSKTIPATQNTFGCSITDELYCTKEQEYKQMPVFSASYHFNVNLTLGIFADYFGNNNRYVLENGRMALYYMDATDTTSIVSNGTPNGGVTFEYATKYNDNPDPVWTYNQASFPFNAAGENTGGGVATVSTNIPIFRTQQEAFNYIGAPSEESALLILATAINYKETEYEPEKTKVYTYTSRHANVSLLRGNVTEISNIGYRTLKIQANKQPAFYINDDTFEVELLAPEVLASVYVPGPEQVADNIPESEWTVGSLAYSGPFYTSVSKWIYLNDETPPDGNYVYPIEYQTNIPVFSNREDAEEAIATGDYSKAGPSGIKEYDVKIGSEEEETEFGGGGFMSPFFTILSGGKTDIHRLADFLFSDDQSVWEDIKKGLEMYGSNPIDYIISLKAFPFSVDRVVNESDRHDIYFGSYMKHFETPFNEVINMAHKYIDAGSFFMYPIQYCYLDFEPYTTLSAYFPYHGWEQLDIKKYYQKTVNVRYYVDILTGQAIIVTVCDGVITDQFGPCEIGTELPLTGANFAQWAQGQVRLLTQSASSLVGGISGGVTSGNVAGFAASSLTSLIPASQALHEARQQGGPKNTMITKGNFGSNLGNYLPGYVIFRFDIHEMLEPDLLGPLAGRPSYSSGVIRSFSGFVSGKVVKMDTSGMSDSEANRIKQMIMNGIYV